MKQIRIAYFTEGNYKGKVSVHNNMTAIMAWQYHFKSDHYSLHRPDTWELRNGEKYDIGIVLPPKSQQGRAATFTLLPNIKEMCNKVALEQEGSVRLWTDLPLDEQIQFLSLFAEADFILCHNDSDQKFYEGIFAKNVHVMRTVLVHESIPPKSEEPLKSPIIGGNMCAWYNGMPSFLIARQYLAAKKMNEPVYAPSMGRRIPNEETLDGLQHLPYMPWANWMQQLSRFELGVHMMPTVAAGSFALNCAYWGIPCIGNEKLDTQRICYPLLSVDVDDMHTAIKIAQKLAVNKQFYDLSSKQAREMYDKYFHPDVFIKRMKQIFGYELGYIEGLIGNPDVSNIDFC